MRATPAIVITIQNSSVGGDVIAGNKTVNVHLHSDQIQSTEAALNALAELGLDAKLSEEVLERIVANPDVWKRLDDNRAKFEIKETDLALREAISEYERIGPNEQTISRLQSLLERSQQRGQGSSFVQIGALLLQIFFNKIDYFDTGIPISEKIIEYANKDRSLQVYVPVARSFQAAQYFLRYFRRIHDLNSTLEYYRIESAKFPPINFFNENKEALGYLKLADAYLSEALDLAYKVASKEIMIIVLNMFGFIALNNFYLHTVILERDPAAMREHVFRIYQTIWSGNEKFGSAADKATTEMNVAHYYNLLGDHTNAETLAIRAAKELAAHGRAHEASKALKIVELARLRERPKRIPDDFKMPDILGGELIEKMIKDISASLINIQGFNLEKDPKLKAAIEIAYRDINPERVMKFCKKIVIDYKPSPIGQSIHLHSLGINLIACSHFERGRESSTGLDDNFISFKAGLNCQTCQYREPRPASWHWSVSKDESD